MRSKKTVKLTANLARLHDGDFNYMGQEQQSDGTVLITLAKDGEPKGYRFRVRDLYGPNEEEVDYATGKPIPKGDIRDTMPEV